METSAPVIRAILGTVLAFRPAAPMETSAPVIRAILGPVLTFQLDGLSGQLSPVLHVILGAFQDLRPPAPMEASVAGLPGLPERLPGPPASCSDGDLGRR